RITGKGEKMIMSKVCERHHRLPRECYCGEITVVFTACILKKRSFFLSNKIVAPNVAMLARVLVRNIRRREACGYRITGNGEE
ncbi:hypothetical protein DRQ11_12570, partial [candidate division KSB1 bacterium]